MPFFFYDPTFVWLLPALALALYAQLKVSRTFNRYAQVPSARGMTGAGVAAELLRRRGIRDVKVEPVQGPMGGGLSDHYDPRTKTLRLSEQVYGGSSVAAIGVAAHEAGHGLQPQAGDAPLALRGGVGVLNAAALTYVAAAFMAVMQLVRLLVLRNMRDE